ncbi:MEDS domain-containing protein [Actinoplanes sp. NPDC024001]|uniref:MEDS domain-containing protein n=1 Tax=Actinoplanes sp. NPDC024001 TaxID=3154598 RepID=UPI0033EFC9C5
MTDAGSIERLLPGDHACVVVGDDHARLRSLTTFIRAGLREHHRILYFGPGADAIEAELGTAAAAALGSGQLRMGTPETTYLASGAFDPRATVEGWRVESAIARDAGYHGLRAIGDMSWASRPVPGAELLAGYEAQVNRVFADGYAMAMCLYDRRLFSEAELQRVCWAHPATVEDGTDPRGVPQLRAVRTGDPVGIRLEGEADLTNRHALRAVMENLAADMPVTEEPLVVDVSGLRFIDAAAARILTGAAAADATRIRVVGCTPAMRRLLVFNGASAITGLTVEPAA